MAQSLSIRKVTVSDLTEFILLFKALKVECGDAPTLDKNAAHHHLFTGKNNGSAIVAVDGGKYLGFIVYHDYNNIYISSDIRHIDFLFVSQQARGLGIASALIQYSMRDARKDGCSYIDIDVNHDNSKALSLYRSIGFVARGIGVSGYRLLLSVCTAVCLQS